MRKRKSYWRRWGVRNRNPHKLSFTLKDLKDMLGLMKTEEEIILGVPGAKYTPPYGTIEEWWDDPLKAPAGIIECTPSLNSGVFYPYATGRLSSSQPNIKTEIDE